MGNNRFLVKIGEDKFVNVEVFLIYIFVYMYVNLYIKK